MKKPNQLPRSLRLVLGFLAMLAGLGLSWALWGLDGMGLLTLLPFAGLFVHLNPELWYAEK